MKSMLLRLVTTTLIISSLSLSAHAQSEGEPSIDQRPMSENPLTNAIIDKIVELHKANPEIRFTEIGPQLKTLFKNGNDLNVLLQLNKVFLQIATETRAGMRSFSGAPGYTQNGSFGGEVNYGYAVRDSRLAYLLALGVYSPYPTIFLHMYRLSDADFAIFADDFIQMLKKARAELNPTNQQVETETVTRHVARELDRPHPGEYTPDEIARLTPSWERTARKEFQTYRRLTVTYAEHMLLMSLGSSYVYHGGIDSSDPKGRVLVTTPATLKLRQRVLDLLLRAMEEPSLFQGAEDAVQNRARQWLNSEFYEDAASQERLKRLAYQHQYGISKRREKRACEALFFEL